MWQSRHAKYRVVQTGGQRSARDREVGSGWILEACRWTGARFFNWRLQGAWRFPPCPLAGCATGGGSSDNSSTAAGGSKSDKNPFGMADKSTVEAVIFNGGYGFDYVTFAAGVVQKEQAGSKVTVKPSTQIAQELQPRFVGGNPPDLIDNSGANAIGLNTIADQLEDLSDVFAAKNLEGTTIKDTLYPGVEAPGTINGKLVAINYVQTVYALWYSSSLFEANGWTPPKTWDEALDLGAKAKAKGKFLFLWGKEAATYYQTLAISSAIKEGGDEVRLALENLKPDAGRSRPCRASSRPWRRSSRTAT